MGVLSALEKVLSMMDKVVSGLDKVVSEPDKLMVCDPSTVLGGDAYQRRAETS